jgi:NADPH2:quinone reductase
LQLAELPIPEPGPGQVLIRVEATGVNFIEIYFRKGVYKAALPLTPGSEAAGTVEEAGPGRDWICRGRCGGLGERAGQLCRVRAGSRGATGEGAGRAEPGKAAAAMLQG